MINIRKFIGLLFATVLLSSISTTSFAIDKLHFVIGGGAGGGWDGTARGTGEALTKSGMLKSASFENMSGGGGGKALAFMINTKPEGTVLVQSTPLVLRSITRHKGYVKGSGVLSYKDVVPIAGVIGDYGAIAVAKNSPFKKLTRLFSLGLIAVKSFGFWLWPSIPAGVVGLISAGAVGRVGN